MHHLYKQFMLFTTSFYEVIDVLTRDLELDGMTRVQFNILQQIALEQPITLSQISYCQNMSLPNVSREIRKFIKNGWVYKFKDNQDKRKTFLMLDQAGIKITKIIFSQMEKRFLTTIDKRCDTNQINISNSIDNISELLFKPIISSKK
ncbi:MarR family transcriptional regulator [Arsenophonus nasoniae]|uniref:MarR family protein n=1 Tax=Arsenophonus nasoniae TaxID=638 RepID=D2U0K9_9GAMM|nr:MULTISPECIES: MarR family transcriptional regulator [Arsenophonus]QBY43319.1 MarR family protein [Arsenophonus nasoniae]WGL94221.1 MarR family transcriptional regulator [Arsenophonus nasoniae]WGL99590.1 MarR family transcriptional regulator [Arsenophonus sp. aPb]WGM03013.1 MarR family transcriptional regulator [Arsenophonus nasoniae]WGM07327.1 MarR family transcriptional regulator [Arsenophonus nasoniae]